MKSIQNHSLRQLWKLLLFSIILTLGMQNGYKVFAADTTVTSVCVNNGRVAVITTGGSLYMWGKLYEDEQDVSFSTPVKVASDVKSVSLGYAHTVFLKTDGTFWEFGDNYFGQILNGQRGEVYKNPLEYYSSEGIKAASAGSSYTAIIENDDTLWVGGNNSGFQLGIPTTGSRGGSEYNFPQQLMSGVKAVSAGGSHTAIVKNDGTLWMCGFNEYGQIGNGSTLDVKTPEKVMAGVKAAYVSPGFTTAIIKNDDSLWMCGKNHYGQLGDGTTETRLTPVKIMSGVKAVSLSGYHTAILKTDGTLWMCGWNPDGELGDGTYTDRLTPVKVMSGVKAVSVDERTTAVIKNDGTLWMCGNNWEGLLFDGTNTNRLTPVKISLPKENVEKSKNTITADDIIRKFSLKKQSFNIKAAALGGAKLSYKSSNSKISVNKSGTITVKAGYVGKATITITAAETEQYSKTTAKIKVRVNPGAPSKISVTNSDKGMITVKWKKSASTKATGYQIQYSTSVKFTKKTTKTVNVKGVRKVSKTIPKLKKGKKYYVRIRTYLKYGSDTYYSPWVSKTVAVKK